MAWNSTNHDGREAARIASGSIGVDDVVRHVAARCADVGVAIPTNKRAWYLLFERVRNDSGAPDPVRALYFDPSGASQELVETLHSLTISRSLLLAGQSFDRYEVPDTNKKKWLDQLKAAPEEYKIFLKEAYKAAREIFPSIELRA
ncbi:MAG TPA: hypothetical protein VL944_00910 [Candidatus Acidoferrum sp.]|nr:hypothetical protein [Candidatus Acidoferrum sp.]